MRKRIVMASSLLLVSLGGFSSSGSVLANNRPIVTRSLQETSTKVPMPVMLKLVAKRYQVKFNYNYRLLSEKITSKRLLDDQTATIDELLPRLLNPLGLTFERFEHNVFLIYPKVTSDLQDTGSRQDLSSSPFASASYTPTSMLNSVETSLDIPISGRVTSETGEGLPGVTILVKGTLQGTTSDASGRYTLSVADQKTILVFSYVGYASQEMIVGNRSHLDVRLVPANKSLSEVVVIGYGTKRRQDLTGSAESVSSKEFVQGQITNPEQLITGKMAGVQITSNGGAPGAGSTIRIRGGSSLNASNDPLIVLDGVPLDNTEISGTSNALNLINPNDIENVTVLKDASATAIYGSRASNGVIIITTKKGIQGDQLHLNVNTQFSLASKTKELPVLTGDELRNLVNQQGTSAQKAFLGQANTDWQQAIFQTARTSDNNISLTGSLAKIPFRLSGGYLNQTGIVQTSKLERYSAALGLTPVLLDNHLRIDINLKGTLAKNRFADPAAISSAVAFDPTQSIYSGTEKFGGYFEWLQADGNPNQFATRNPVGLLNLRNDISTVNRSIGNVQFDYKFHFLPSLRANLNLGYDISKSDGTTYVPAFAASQFTRPGINNQYAQHKTNKLLEFYLQYRKDIPKLKSQLELLGGYSYQDFIRENPAYPDLNAEGVVITPAAPYPFKTQNTLVSFYGRLNYTLNNRYLLTATVRDDGSSRFSADNRWGVFPSVALAWRLREESFLKTATWLSDLKLRVGYGLTGQQDVISDYPYLARYTIGQGSAQYQFGNQFYSTFRPEGYDKNIRWESTTTYNAGLDYGLLGGKISGSLDVYLKKTSNLLSIIPVAAGSNLTNQILTNVGSLENRGVEFSIKGTPIQHKDLTWDVNLNFTYNQNQITKLTQVTDPTFQGNQVGSISGGKGNTIQIQSVGYQTFSYYVYKQVYDPEGKPVEGLYADLNGDGKITADDRYRYQSPNPRLYGGFSSNLTYRSFTLAFTLRSNLGNYVYNDVNANLGVFNVSSPTYLSNVTADALRTGFHTYQYFSDYYIQNASFLRMENATLGYDASRLMSGKWKLRFSLAAQNLFVVTKYTGLDPEIPTGIDSNFYPRARTVTLSANLSF